MSTKDFPRTNEPPCPVFQTLITSENFYQFLFCTIVTIDVKLTVPLNNQISKQDIEMLRLRGQLAAAAAAQAASNAQNPPPPQPPTSVAQSATGSSPNPGQFR